VLRPAPTTFPTEDAADAWLDQTEAKMVLGEWLNPDGGLVPFGNYADEWLADRPFAPKTRQTYEGLLRLHIKPALGAIRLADMDSHQVRRWHGRMTADGRGQVIRAKAYRLLWTILNTAVEDDLIPSNPCKIKALVLSAHQNDRCSTWPRCSRSPRHAATGGVRWCSWRRSLTSDGASWLPCAGTA
jgi:Phage integrase, N-terminal SAM-like domain